MLLFGLASSFLWPTAHVCLGERGLVGGAGRADKEACVPLASSPSPRGPRREDSVASLCCIDQEFQMNCFLGSTLLLGPLFHISKLYPSCYLSQKCSCVAPGKTLSNVDNTHQTPASHAAPSSASAGQSGLCVPLFTVGTEREVFGFGASGTPESQSEWFPRQWATVKELTLCALIQMGPNLSSATHFILLGNAT